MKNQNQDGKKRPVFPPAIQAHTRYAHFATYATKTRILYGFVLGILCLGFAGLFVVRVPLQVQAEGLLITGDTASGELYPDKMVLRTYVQPADIGLIQPGMRVSAQVDGYDPSLWGNLQGVVFRKHRESVMTPAGPVFPVDAYLQSEYLELKNGYRGPLISGMRLRAGFLVAKRRLFEWILDKPDAKYTLSSGTAN